MLRSHLLRIAAFAALATLVLFNTSSAVTINVDYNQDGGVAGTYSGAAVVGSASDLWNAVSAGGRLANTGTTTSGALLDTTGTPTAVTATLGPHTAYDAAVDPNPANVAPALMSDFAAASANNTPMTFSIQGLVPGGTYDLYLYSQNGGYGTESQTFTIGGVNHTAANAGNPGVLTEGVNYVAYHGLTASGGVISGSVLDQVGQASFNGFQLVSVPEPASLVLAGLGLVSLGWVACRRVRSQRS